MKAILNALAMLARVNITRAQIFILRYITAAFGDHSNFESISFGKKFHPKQIKTFAPCAKVIGSSRGILHGFMGAKVTLEDKALIILCNTDPEIFDF